MASDREIFHGEPESGVIEAVNHDLKMLEHMRARGTAFREELRAVLNRYSCENGSNTPDYVLADFVMRSLAAFDVSTNARERYYSRSPSRLSVPPQAFAAELPEGAAKPDADQIVCQEWQRAVKEYSLTPGSVTEVVVCRILNRIRGITPAG